MALPAGTAVSVKLTDTIDSAHDPFGKQYAASVASPVGIAGGDTIAAGSRATVVLIHNNSGWMTQLKALTVNGRKLEVSSSAGILAAKPSPAVGILQQIGIGSASPAGSPQRVLLPPATELRFSLIGSATPARVVAATPRSRPPSHIGPSLGMSSAVSRQEPSGIAYLCNARDTSNPVLPFSYYVADVFETSDDPASVEKRWYQYLVATYPYRFAKNTHAIIQCTRLPDLAAERDVRKKLEGESKSENGQIVETRWRYTLGPTPVPATSPARSTLPAPGAPAAPTAAELRSHPQTP
jgi:hypothetical protein